ncbi:MAG: glycosyltransferase family 39 protein [Edaphobacter sp.]
MTTRLDETPVDIEDGAGLRVAGLPVPGWAILLVTAVMSLTWSAHKLLWQDEIFSFQTDRVASLGEVLRIQGSYPISLEPPPYHIMSHAAMKVLGPTAFALRLPAFAGFLLMQVCLYFFVRNLAGWRAGLVAMAFPALTWTMYYSTEGRPYGVLLGAYALAALCWQVASRREGTPEQRTTGRVWPLVGLALTLALALNVHFYGVLLLIPMCGAELVRTVSRRRLDGGMLAAIVAGMASLVATIPYVKASGEFKQHYYAAAISVHMLTQPYRQMIMDYTTYPHIVQTVLALLLMLVGALVVWGCVRAVRRRTVAMPAAEWALVLLLALMPVFAFALGKLVTHALEVRHSIGAIVGISVLFAIAIAPMLRRKSVFYAVMVVMLTGIVAVNLIRVLQAMVETAQTMATLTVAPELKSKVDAMADRNIYFQDLGMWEVASLYEPDPELRSRLVLVYSRNEEMSRRGHDTMYLTAVHTKRFSDQPIVSYDDLRKMPGEHAFATFHSGWSWTDDAFADEAAHVEPMGEAFDGDLVKVQFR